MLPADGPTRVATPSPPRLLSREVLVRTSSLVRRLAVHASTNWPVVHISFIGYLGLVAVTRYSSIAALSVPLGIDPGNWLAQGYGLMGEHVRSSSIVYPPVVPLLALLATWMFGLVTGVKLLSVFASVFPAIGAYVLMRGSGLKWTAFVCAALLAPAASTGEAMAWGGFPQLLGLGLLLVFLWRLDAWLRSGLLKDALIAGLLAASTLATSDLIGGCAVVIGSVLVAMHLIVRPSPRAPITQIIKGAAILALFTLPLVPLYLQLVRAIMQTSAGVTKLTPGEAVAQVSSIFRDFPFFWRSALFLVLLVPFIAVRRRRDTLWLVTTALLIPPGLLLVFLGEQRFVYVLPIAIVVGLSLWIRDLRLSRFPSTRAFGLAMLLALAAALGAESINGLTFFRTQQVKYYTLLNPGLMEGLEWLRQRTPADAIIAVSPTRDDYAIGWWVEGVARRPTVYGSDPAWLNFPDERKRAAVANAIFDPNETVERSEMLASCFGASYLFVDKAWSAFATWSRTARDLPTSSIVIDNQSLLLLRVGTDVKANAVPGYRCPQR